jgi:hypothetical protein
MTAYTATGQFYVGKIGVTIFGGYHHWPIIGPDGEHYATVVGDATAPDDEPDAKWISHDRSRAPADKIVEALNFRLNMIAAKASEVRK